MKPIIGIVGRTNKIQDSKYKIIVNDNHRRAIIESGGIPISILPTQNIEYEKIDNGKVNVQLNKEEQDDLIEVIKICDGIILQGGYYSYYYDEFIAKYCIENDIPVLGTCLGAQVLAAVDCNTSRKKNTKLIETEINHNQYERDYAHEVQINPNSFLHSIINTDLIKVNSRHKYGIINVNNAIIAASSEDGVIEAIEFPNHKFALGLQWHPEDLFEIDDNMLKIFKTFINTCSIERKKSRNKGYKI